MTRLERDQVPIYVVALGLGAAWGLLAPGAASALEGAIWPVVGALLYVTFLQVPLLGFRRALGDVRFLAAMLTANFVFVPPVVWVLLRLLPPSPPIVLGAALVLLAPCTDWMNTFTLLGRGDAHRTLAATPLLLVAQVALLPPYLWLFLEREAARLIATGPFVRAFVGLIVVPLGLAWATEWRAGRSARVAGWVARSAPLTVLLLAATVAIIAASQARPVVEQAARLSRVTLVFALYVALAAVVGRQTARLYRLPPRAGRGVVFSVGTRNSFVVLPLALALPPAWQLAVAVIVIQAFVEMLGMLLFVRLVPTVILPEPGPERGGGRRGELPE